MKKQVLLFLFLLFVAALYFVNVESGAADTAVATPEPIPIINNIPHLAAPAQRYIIQLSAPPAALVSQRPAAAGAYRSYLAAQQSSFLTTTAFTLGRPLQPIFQYDVAFNGITLLLRSDEVDMVRGMAGVTAVYLDLEETLATDSGPAWIGANTIWDGSSVPGNSGNKGEGIIVGVIDTGINMDHPSFAQIGGDGYEHQNPFGDGNFKGACDPLSGQYDPQAVCNSKLIGAWDFADGFGENDGPEDSNGHGSHTASTAAGNVVAATIALSGYEFTTTISGVAPHANIIAYDVCVFSCAQSSLLAAINQAVIDGVDVINYSISGGTSPFSDPVSQAFLAANEAGIFVSAAAGNDGPGVSTLSHQEPWVMTVGAMTHDRLLVNQLINFTGGNFSLTDISGKSLTDGYGPAPIVYAGDYGDPLCLNAFSPGTFTNEIVVCDRGEIARVQKGENVLVGGAKGMVLANRSIEGDSLNADAHVLPAVHITYTDGVALKAWLAVGSNHMATIAGTTKISDPALADKMADFSSRGPNTAMDVLKPDITGPGVDILAAIRTTAPLDAPEYGLMSGTSMATPHLTGAAALLRKVHPSWTPDEVRSALMMTAMTDNLLQEDGVSTAVPFDRGAGRVDLSRAAKAGLVLHETHANYVAAEAGDPTTLNLPSMAESSCFTKCNWVRTVRSVLDESVTWTATAVTSNGLQIAVTPNQFSLAPGAMQTLQMQANVTQVAGGSEWVFATILLESPGQESLQMPVAVRKSLSSNPGVLSKTAPDFAEPDQIITYKITLDNLDNMTHTFRLTDTLPVGVTYLPGPSSSELVYDDINHQLTWEGNMGLGTLGYEVTAVNPPLPYINLGDLPDAPANLCASFVNCDDGIVHYDLSTDGVSYTFYDETLSDIFVSANGLLLGPESIQDFACTACPEPLPTDSQLNQVIAGLWRDLDASQGVGQWYAALLDGWLPGSTVFYANWHDVGHYGDPFTTSRHAIAVVLDGQSEPNGRIYYLYDSIPNPAAIAAHGYVVGVEDKGGVSGETIAFAPCVDAICVQQAGVGSLPASGTTLRLDPAVVGGPSAKTFTYQVQVTAEAGTLLTNTVEVTSDGLGETVTAVADVFVEYRRYFPLIFK